MPGTRTTQSKGAGRCKGRGESTRILHNFTPPAAHSTQTTNRMGAYCQYDVGLQSRFYTRAAVPLFRVSFGRRLRGAFLVSCTRTTNHVGGGSIFSTGCTTSKANPAWGIGLVPRATWHANITAAVWYSCTLPVFGGGFYSYGGAPRHLAHHLVCELEWTHPWLDTIIIIPDTQCRCVWLL